MIHNELKKYNFQLAQNDDIETIMQIIAEAQESLKELNINQWQDGYPNKEIIINDIKEQNAYVLKNEKNIIAYSAIIFNKETSYEKIYSGNWLTNNEFIVAHRVAVSKKYRRQGITSILFQNIETLAKSKNIKSFKIDTHEENIVMNNFLKKNGFCYCGIIYLSNGNKRLAYEKII